MLVWSQYGRSMRQTLVGELCGSGVQNGPRESAAASAASFLSERVQQAEVMDRELRAGCVTMLCGCRTSGTRDNRQKLEERV